MSKLFTVPIAQVSSSFVLSPRPAKPSGEDLRDLALRMYYASDEGKRVVDAEARLASAKAERADRPLLKIAVAQTIAAMLVIAYFQRPGLDGNPHVLFVELCAVALAAAFWGLWAWSLVNPLPAAIVGLLMYTSVGYAAVAHEPIDHPGASHINGGVAIWWLINIILLVRAIIAGSRQRRRTLGNQVAAAPLAPIGRPAARPRGIASAIWLYLVLLSIVTIPASLAADHELTLHDFFDVHKLMAIVVLTWAAIAWRDTLPAVRRIGSPVWLLVGVLGGMGTFAVASIYHDVLTFTFHLAQPDTSGIFLAGGYGWLTVLGMVAVFPAIFEELAFRGVILPCLGRVLSTSEAVVASGLMFMILHLTVPSAPPLLLAGICLGLLRVRSGSLWPGVLMHFTHNALCIAFEHWH